MSAHSQAAHRALRAGEWRRGGQKTLTGSSRYDAMMLCEVPHSHAAYKHCVGSRHHLPEPCRLALPVARPSTLPRFARLQRCGLQATSFDQRAMAAR